MSEIIIKELIKKKKPKQLPCSHGNAWEQFKGAPVRDALVFVLRRWAEIRHPIPSIVCLSSTGMADQINPFCFGGSLLSSGQGKWNRNVIWDINKWLGQLPDLHFPPPFLAGPAFASCALVRVPLSSSQATSDPKGSSLTIRPTFSSWVKKWGCEC